MPTATNQGFILLPVVLACALVASVAYLMNRDGAENVHMLGGEIAATQAEYIAQAGLKQMLWQANNSNCSGYSNATNVDFGGQTFSGTISPTSNSPVSINVTATQAQGASYTISRDRLKVYQAPKTKILQLGDSPGKDAYISSTLSSNNYGVGEDSILASWLFTWLYRNQLIQFDVGVLPDNAHIISAQLQLYRNSGSGKNTINLFRMTSDWVEGTKSGSGTADGVTWKTYDGSNAWANNGGDFDQTLIAKADVEGSSAGIQSWEIGSLVQKWLSGDYPNYGLLLKVNEPITLSGGVSLTFASKEDAVAANRPKLIINYNCECGLTCIGHECVPGNYRDEFSAINYTGKQGSFAWSSDWLESGESDGAGAGKLSVVSAIQCASGNCLKIRKDTTVVMGISRGMNLANVVSAVLTYKYFRTVVLVPGGGAITLQISKDAGATYTALKSYALNAIDVLANTESIDISAYASANTRIRFISSGASFQSNIHIDDINVAVDCVAPPSSSKSITLNPVADTYLNAASTGTNYGSVNTLSVGAEATGKKIKGLLKFNVSSIPSTAIVTAAKLRLFGVTATGTGSMAIGLYKIIANWSESTATWANFSTASNYKSTQLAFNQAPLATDIVVEWPIPVSLINEWRDGVPTPNYGMALVYESILGNVRLDFAASENTSSALLPQLVIDYSLP